MVRSAALTAVSPVPALVSAMAKQAKISRDVVLFEDLASTLPTRRLGSLKVSVIGFSFMNLTRGYGPELKESDVIKLVRGAFNREVTFFDMAQTCDAAYSEEVIVASLPKVRPASS